MKPKRIAMTHSLINHYKLYSLLHVYVSIFLYSGRSFAHNYGSKNFPHTWPERLISNRNLNQLRKRIWPCFTHLNTLNTLRKWAIRIWQDCLKRKIHVTNPLRHFLRYSSQNWRNFRLSNILRSLQLQSNISRF